VFTQFDWLALEVRALEPALAWYTDVLDLAVRDRTAGAARLEVGDGGESLRLVEPGVGPRGGVHVHYALTIPPEVPHASRTVEGETATLLAFWPLREDRLDATEYQREFPRP